VLSKDLSIAKIYFTNLNSMVNLQNYQIDSATVKNILIGFKNASSFLRSKLASRVSLRKVPELKFFHDENTIHGNKIDNLLNNINLDPIDPSSIDSIDSTEQ
jgi:ribosome-binding factor A